MMKKIQGFTLLELLVVIGIIAVLATIVIVALNPARQFAQARDAARWSHVNTILNAVGQNMADNRGNWTCASGGLPTSTTQMGSGGGNYNINPCIVPLYVSIMPLDPATGTSTATGYNILYVSSTRRTTISVIAPEIETSISVTR